MAIGVFDSLVERQRAHTKYRAAIWWKSIRQILLTCVVAICFLSIVLSFSNSYPLNSIYLYVGILISVLVILWVTIIAAVNAERRVILILGLNENELRYDYKKIIREYEEDTNEEDDEEMQDL